MAMAVLWSSFTLVEDILQLDFHHSHQRITVHSLVVHLLNLLSALIVGQADPHLPIMIQTLSLKFLMMIIPILAHVSPLVQVVSVVQHPFRRLTFVLQVPPTTWKANLGNEVRYIELSVSLI
jgi:hypothetical protein